MSRSTVAKSRAEKAGKGSTYAPTPAITQEIVPGKYNDQDWNSMLDHDDGDDFVFDIVDTICNSAVDVIFENYIQKQLVPYTVSQAKDAILQIIEWQFLARDEGESDVEDDSGWIQDEEPEPAITDCWAQGSVPRLMATPRGRTPRTIMEEDKEPEALDQETAESKAQSRISQEEEEAEEQGETIGGDEDEEEEEDSVPMEAESLQEEQSLREDGGGEEEEEEEEEEEGEEEEEEEKEEEEEDQEEQDQEEEEKQREESPPPKIEQKKKKRKFKRHTGPLKSAGVGKMTESLDQTEMRLMMVEESPSMSRSPDPAMMQMPASCHSILKLQNGRPPGNRDILYDESGNVVSVTRIDPDKLPSHKVKTAFHVVDPAVEAAQAQLEAMRTGRYLKAVGRKQLVPQPPDSPRSTVSRTTVGKNTHTTNKTNASQTAYGRTKEGVTPLPPPLIESMEVSPGVVVREGERVKHGPRQHPRKADLIASATQTGLRPLAIRANVPTLTVAQLLEHKTPVVRPLVDSPPIPPIGSRTQISSQ